MQERRIEAILKCLRDRYWTPSHIPTHTSLKFREIHAKSGQKEKVWIYDTLFSRALPYSLPWPTVVLGGLLGAHAHRLVQHRVLEAVADHTVLTMRDQRLKMRDQRLLDKDRGGGVPQGRKWFHLSKTRFQTWAHHHTGQRHDHKNDPLFEMQRSMNTPMCCHHHIMGLTPPQQQDHGIAVDGQMSKSKDQLTATKIMFWWNTKAQRSKINTHHHGGAPIGDLAPLHVEGHAAHRLRADDERVGGVAW